MLARLVIGKHLRQKWLGGREFEQRFENADSAHQIPNRCRVLEGVYVAPPVDHAADIDFDSHYWLKGAAWGYLRGSSARANAIRCLGSIDATLTMSTCNHVIPID
eukprot:5852880-Pyramimonas_sp.AAC.3